MITNADQGIALGWNASTACPAPGSLYNPITNMTSNYICTPVTTYGATTVGASASSFSTASGIYPVLQPRMARITVRTAPGNMIRCTQYGNVSWSVPTDSPQIATADGGVIGSSGITYDSQGRATGQTYLPIQSWTGNA